MPEAKNQEFGGKKLIRSRVCLFSPLSCLYAKIKNLALWQKKGKRTQAAAEENELFFHFNYKNKLLETFA